MRENRWLRRAGVASAAVALTVAAAAASSRGDGSTPAAAEDWPTGPVTLVVTFPPGGGTDTLARRLADRLHHRYGHPFVVENRSGASGNIGAQAVARAKPDGHTLLVANSSYAVNPAVFSELGFDPAHDLTGVINVAYVPSVVVTAGQQSPWNDLLSAVEAGRHTSPGLPAPAYASCGNGTPQHLAAGMLNQSTGSQWLHVPYRGCGPALIDVLSGTVGLGVVTASSALPHIRAGTLRALAVTSAQRSALLPDTPTVAELGVSGYELNQWHGLLAPAATPSALVARIHQSVNQVLLEAEMQQDLIGMGYDLAEGDASGFQHVIHSDLDRFASAARAIGLKMN
ncbi:MAG: tripartite tricarboxylate transporter substrate binding protein [Burkholderiaceae bacterium]